MSTQKDTKAIVAQILATIADNASDLYNDRVPSYTRDNLKQIGDAITSDKNIMNEYITALVGKVAFSRVVSKIYQNPLAKLKSQGVPMGSAIEEIFINPATDMGFDRDGNKLLKTTKPDGKVAYYANPRKASYPVSISKVDIMRGFTSEGEYMALVNKIIASMYSGDNIDEFMLMKGLFGAAVDEGAILIEPTDLSDVKGMAKAISTYSKNFIFPSTKYCGYNLVNATKITEGEKPCITFCPQENQVLLMTANAQTELHYEYLASVFNMEVTEIKAMTILVDDFLSETHDVFAVLIDKEAIQVRDIIFEVADQEIGSNLTWNYWLHHWGYLYLSMFGNAVAFAKPKAVEPEVKAVEPEEIQG